MCLGIPGKILELFERDGLKMGRVDFGGVIKEACLAYLPEIEVGSYTIVHAGFGISEIDETEALETLSLLRQLEEFSAEQLVDQPEDPDSQPEA